MKEFTTEQLDEIREIIRHKDAEEARRKLTTLHPADIAEL